MPVSYADYGQPVIKSSPYVQPLDLNLLAKVGTYKQQQYDAGYQKVESQIQNVVSQTQGMNEVQKQYVTSKLNSLVNNINDLGGVDLSDPNISNQLDNYASSIYSDNIVSNALTSAKGAQAIIASYQKIKNDPKLLKQYSAVNEALDLQKVSQYYGAKDPSQNYNGKTSYTPFVNYKDDLVKLLKNKKDNEYTADDNYGKYFIRKTDNKRVSAEEIAQEAAALLSEDGRGQLNRDAEYRFTIAAPTPISNIIKYKADTEYEKIRHQENNVKEYELQLASNSFNDTQKELIRKNKSESENYINLKRNELNTYGTYVRNSNGSTTFIPNTSTESKFNSNPEMAKNLMYDIYSNEVFKGLGSLFAHEKTSTTFRNNDAQMFLDKQSQQQFQFNEAMKFKREQEENKFAIAGMVRNPNTGKYEYPTATTSTTSKPTTIPLNDLTPNVENNIKNEDYFINDNKRIDSEIDNQLINYFDKLKVENSDIASFLGQGEGQKSLIEAGKKVNGNDRFDISDLSPSTLSELQIAESIKANKDKNYQSKFTPKIKEVFSKMYNYYTGNINEQALNAVGKPTSSKYVGYKIPSGFDKVVNDIQLLQLTKLGNKQVVDRYVNNLEGLNEQQKIKYKDYIQNPQKYITSGNEGFPIDRFYETPTYNDNELPAIIDIVNNNTKNKKVFEDISNRLNFYGKVYKEPKTKEDIDNINTLKAVASNIILDDKGKSNTRILPGSEAISSNVKDADIQIKNMSVRTDGQAGYQMSVIVTDGKKEKIVKLAIDDKIAATQGFIPSPYQSINTAVENNGQTPIMHMTFGNVSAAIRVVNLDSKNRNSKNNTVQLLIPKVGKENSENVTDYDWYDVMPDMPEGHLNKSAPDIAFRAAQDRLAGFKNTTEAIQTIVNINKK